jgi:peptide/nickel transport system substrate-binding protein
MTALSRLMMATALATCPVAPAALAADLIVGFTLDADTLDPANHRKRETETIIRNIHDGLLTRDPNMVVVPEIAESMTQVSPTVYDFKIRSGIKFHDGSDPDRRGRQVHARPHHRRRRHGQRPDQPASGPDGPGRLRRGGRRMSCASTSRSRGRSCRRCCRTSRSSPRPLSKRSDPKGMATQPNGTGPFKLAEWRKGDAVILERFDDYYGGASDIAPVGKACVDRVIFKIIPESASRVAALLSGDVRHHQRTAGAFSIEQVKANPGTDVMTVNGTRSFFIAMNMEGEHFDDVKVRQAAAHAIDKDLIIDRILGGNAAADRRDPVARRLGASDLPAVRL